MFARLNTITNDLYALGKSYTSTELVNKILRSFPNVYQRKMVAIQEARDLSKLPLEKLMGSLMTQKIMIRDHDNDEEEDKKKKKTISFKSSTQDKKEEDDEHSDSELDNIALLTRRYKKYLRFKKGNNLSRSIRREALQKNILKESLQKKGKEKMK